MPVVLVGEMEKKDPWGLLLIQSRWIKALQVHAEIMSQKVRGIEENTQHPNASSCPSPKPTNKFLLSDNAQPKG